MRLPKLKILLSVLIGVSMLGATPIVIDAWDFSEADGTSITATLSTQGKPFARGKHPTANVKNQALEFSYDGKTDAIFAISEFSKQALRTGVYEISWVFNQMDFTQTAAAQGMANVGFDFRDTEGTTYKGKDDTILVGLRLSFEKGQTRIQIQTADDPKFKTVASYDFSVLRDPLAVRLRLDLNKAGNPGSLQAFLKLGNADPEQVVIDATLPAGKGLSGYRVIQQTRNGNTKWAKGDRVAVDDFKILKAE
jgi:hypothetical protein